MSILVCARGPCGKAAPGHQIDPTWRGRAEELADMRKVDQTGALRKK
jgi:hypothetical protein